MKKSDRRRIAAAICAMVPRLQPKGSLLAVMPIDTVLRGVYLESSRTSPEGVYVWTFVQPMFVPATSVVLSRGRRVGGGARLWVAEEADAVAELVAREGMDIFQMSGAPDGLLARLNELEDSDIYGRQARGYALVAAGRLAEGASYLRSLGVSIVSSVPWMVAARSEAFQVAELAENSPDRALALLAEWTRVTTESLGLDRLQA